MLKISEVYEKQIRTVKEKSDGSEYVSFDKAFDTRECLVNKNYIVSVHPCDLVSDGLISKLENSFPEGAKFSTLVLDGNSFRKSEIMVMGSFDKFCRLLQENNS